MRERSPTASPAHPPSAAEPRPRDALADVVRADAADRHARRDLADAIEQRLLGGTRLRQIAWATARARLGRAPTRTEWDREYERLRKIVRRERTRRPKNRRFAATNACIAALDASRSTAGGTAMTESTRTPRRIVREKVTEIYDDADDLDEELDEELRDPDRPFDDPDARSRVRRLSEQ